MQTRLRSVLGPAPQLTTPSFARLHERLGFIVPGKPPVEVTLVAVMYLNALCTSRTIIVRKLSASDTVCLPTARGTFDWIDPAEVRVLEPPRCREYEGVFASKWLERRLRNFVR